MEEINSASLHTSGGNRDDKYLFVRTNIKDCAVFLTGAWVFLMCTVFPLYFGDRYQEMGAYKFSFFSGISVLFLTPAVLLGIVVWVWERFAPGGREWLQFTPARPRGVSAQYVRKSRGLQRQNVQNAHFVCIAKRVTGHGVNSNRKGSWSSVDTGVLLYGITMTISAVFSDHPYEAWNGASGWFMGLRTQLIMVTVYFLTSRLFPWKKLIFYGHFAGSSLAFLFGVLHRFHVDPLGMYRGLDSSYFLQFLSTIGQASWFSSYVCTVLAIGVCFFLFSRSRKWRIPAALYCMLGFMTVVTQNSDSAFVALFMMFTGAFVIACSHPQRMERFLQLMILCAASFKTAGLLQTIFAQRAVELGRLSMELSKGPWAWAVLLAATVCYILLLRWQDKGLTGWEKTGRRLRTGWLIVTVGGIVLAVLFIAGNTAGLFQSWFGFTSGNQYLLFNDKWGSDRGFNWRFAAMLFAGLPPVKRLIGVGPDCFGTESYANPEYAAQLSRYWGNMPLTNAHNEYLNLLICVGIAGLLAFLFFLGAGVLRYVRSSRINVAAAAGAMCILAYAGHNFFCYQQVCCTPFLFLIAGITENAVRSASFSSLEELF